MDLKIEQKNGARIVPLEKLVTGLISTGSGPGEIPLPWLVLNDNVVSQVLDQLQDYARQQLGDYTWEYRKLHENIPGSHRTRERSAIMARHPLRKSRFVEAMGDSPRECLARFFLRLHPTGWPGSKESQGIEDGFAAAKKPAAKKKSSSPGM